MRKLNLRRTDSGSIILPMLVIAGIIGLTLVSFLMLARNQNLSVYRSQAWNASIVLSEAGMEDALQLINKYQGWLEPEEMFKWTNNVGADSWKTVGPNLYYVRRYIGPSYYDVYITNRNNQPGIRAIGVADWNYSYIGSSTFAAINSSQGPPAPKRHVNVQTRYDALFTVAMAASDNIDLQGNNVSSDSYISSSRDHTSNFDETLGAGYYPMNEQWKARDNGSICTSKALVNSLNVGNANIKGMVKTGPGNNTISIGPNGTVGTKAWVESGSKGIEKGRAATDFNVVFPDVVLPAISWFEPDSSMRDKVINGVNYEYCLTKDGDYRISSLTDNLFIGTNCSVRLLIQGNVNMSGSDCIVMAPGKTKLRIYMDGESWSMTGNSFIDNRTRIPGNLFLFGTKKCMAIKFGGNAAFVGGIYAPSAAFALGGGGNNTYDFIGASVTRSVKMNGHFNFHFDEDLGICGPARG
jgi:hypothetical protein